MRATNPSFSIVMLWIWIQLIFESITRKCIEQIVSRWGALIDWFKNIELPPWADQINCFLFDMFSFNVSNVCVDNSIILIPASNFILNMPYKQPIQTIICCPKSVVVRTVKRTAKHSMTNNIQISGQWDIRFNDFTWENKCCVYLV